MKTLLLLALLAFPLYGECKFVIIKQGSTFIPKKVCDVKADTTAPADTLAPIPEWDDD